MRILLATDAYSSIVNGVVTSVKILRKELISMGHEVRVITLSENINSYIDFNEGIYYFGSYDVSKIYPDARFSPFHTMKLIDDIYNWKPDIIHTQSEFTTFRIARRVSKKLNISIVHTYHTLYEQYTHYFSPSEASGKYLVTKLSQYIAKRSKCIIVPTLKTKNALNSYKVNTDIEIIPTGLIMDNFKKIYSRKEIASLKNELNIPANTNVLISIGRVGKEKNIEEIIDYFYKLNNEKLYFVIVGDGPNKDYLISKVKNYNLENKIFFTGLIPHNKLNIYYQMADLFVSASTSETQGLTYIEALANGTPVLCRDDSCLENTVINGYNGFRYTNFENFYNYLNKILNNDDFYNELSTNSKNGATDKFSSTTFANTVLQVYNKYI